MLVEWCRPPATVPVKSLDLLGPDGATSSDSKKLPVFPASTYRHSIEVIYGRPGGVPGYPRASYRSGS